jgi:uncharacterized protein YegL
MMYNYLLPLLTLLVFVDGYNDTLSGARCGIAGGIACTGALSLGDWKLENGFSNEGTMGTVWDGILYDKGFVVNLNLTGSFDHSIMMDITLPLYNSKKREWILNYGQSGSGAHHWLYNPDSSIQFGSWNGHQVHDPIYTQSKINILTTYDASKALYIMYINDTLHGEIDKCHINLSKDCFRIGTKSISNENDFSGIIHRVQFWNFIYPMNTVTHIPTENPSQTPTENPSQTPIGNPSQTPMNIPSQVPIIIPLQTQQPSPTIPLTSVPTLLPSFNLNDSPSLPTQQPTRSPTYPYIYKGCFKDTASRDLDIKVGSRTWSIETCAQECLYTRGYTYFSMQYPDTNGISECFCGNSYGSYGPLAETSCDHSTGDKLGGGWTNAVYGWPATGNPSQTPIYHPSQAPIGIPSQTPFGNPSHTPTIIPSQTPTYPPSQAPIGIPSQTPFGNLSHTPTIIPSQTPIMNPSHTPTIIPSQTPTYPPSQAPIGIPSQTPMNSPSQTPTNIPSQTPTIILSEAPTGNPSHTPTIIPSQKPTENPSQTPTNSPSQTPTENPSQATTNVPSQATTNVPSQASTNIPSNVPSHASTNTPSQTPTNYPSQTPTNIPSQTQTNYPSQTPTIIPSQKPTLISITSSPTSYPTTFPSYIKEVDIFFVLDISGSTERDYIENIINFLENFALEKFNTYDNTRIAVSVFASKARYIHGIDTIEAKNYEKFKMSLSKIKNVISEGWTNTGNAIRYVGSSSKYLGDKRRKVGDKTQVPGIVFLITTGVPNRPKTNASRYFRYQVEKIKKKHQVKLFVLQFESYKKIYNFVSDNNVLLKSFDDLKKQDSIEKIKRKFNDLL